MRLLTALVLAAATQVAPGSQRAGGPGSVAFDWRTGADLKKWLREQEPRLTSGDGCELFAYWTEDGAQRQGSLSNVVLVALQPAEGESTYLVTNAAPGVDARLGVRYAPSGDGRLWLDVALAVEGAREDVFHELSRSQARVLRSPSASLLEVEKPVRIANRVWTLRLACGSGKTFMHRFRRGTRGAKR